MEQQKSGALLNSSPYFDGNNYSFWKVRMMFFLKMKGERVWNSIEYGWGPPLILDTQGRSKVNLNLKKNETKRT